MRRAAIGLGLLCALLAGCESRVVPFELDLVTRACAGTPPMEGVTHLWFRVTGDDLEPIVRSGSVTLGRVEIPDIPAGKNRQLEVRGYEGAPPNGRVLSVGRSLPFEVPELVPSRGRAETVTVFLRRAGTFTPPSLAASPEACVRMVSPRAAHSATALRDGRVLIAGGYQRGSAGEVQSLDSLELYNPAVGAFEAVDERLSYATEYGFPAPSPRAFHSADLLPDGRVLIAGGEYRDETGAHVRPDAILFDPIEKMGEELALVAARSRHASAVDFEGRVLLVGGAAETGAAVATAEWFDPATGKTEAISTPVPRLGTAAVPVQAGKVIAIAGGSDGATVAPDVLFLRFDGSTFVGLGSSAPLKTVRRAPGVALFQNDKLVIAGGYGSASDSATDTQSLATSEVIRTAAFVSAEGPAVSPRGELCAVRLPDGRVLTVGGRSGAYPLLMTDASADLLTATPSGALTVLGGPSLPVSRYRHSCTLLADGTVLVAGGEFDDTTTVQSLQDAFVFTPAPID